ncbi:rod shape-determining protein MreC [Zavarzinia sp. CC-PAN008]|uniref:rod shape-determining protein MreC n=1 Tax=Zavarzinia sp. CC-PAN008 TaxID=3243332 RepID=UPI003F74975A
MRQLNTGPVLRLAQPLKLVVQRFAYATLLATAAGLLILGKADAVLLERGRTFIMDNTAPLLDAISRPVTAVREMGRKLNELANVYDENERLREENARLRLWADAARQMQKENERVRALTQLRPEPEGHYIAARVIADTGGPFVRTVVIDAGTIHGVAVGQIVLDDQGVLGRVTAAGERSARVLLITDLNSRVPILLESTHQRGVLAGNNDDTPRLTFLRATIRPQVGERIVTSGHGGLFPPGLPVGIIESVRGSEPRVRPWADWSRLEYVRVLHYEGPIEAIETDGGRPQWNRGSARAAPAAAPAEGSASAPATAPAANSPTAAP